MSRPAQITSTDAVRQFKLALEEFQGEAREAVTQLLLEMRRAVDWIEHDRARYWPREMQRASDALLQARNDLERCEMSIRPEDKRSCYEQKIAVEKAKRRLRLTEDKVRAVRRWRLALSREVDDFQGRLAKLTSCLDMDLPRALAVLERMAAALDRYTERPAPVEATGSNGRAEGREPPGASGRAGGREPPGASGRAEGHEPPGISGRAGGREPPGVSERAGGREPPGVSGRAGGRESPGASGRAEGREPPGAGDTP